MSPSYIKSRDISTNKWVVLTIVSLGTILTTLDGGMVQVGYPALAKAFNLDPSDILWVTVSFWITSVGLMLTLGWIGDVAGRKNMFVLGFLIFSIALISASLSQYFWQLIVSRILQGVGSALLLSNLNALITTAFPEEERGTAIGISGGVVGVGLTVGPLAAGMLLDMFDWRVMMYSKVPIGVLGAILGWYYLRKDTVIRRKYRIDLLGALALFGSMATFLIFINKGGKDGFNTSIPLIMVPLCIIFLTLYIRSEFRSLRPIFELQLFNNSYYSIGVLLHFCHYLAHGGLVLIGPFYMINSLGYSYATTGFVIACFYLTRSFLAPIAGKLSDHFSPFLFTMMGNLLLGTGIIWISFLDLNTSPFKFAIAMSVASSGVALVEPVLTSVIMGSVPKDRIGTASAVIGAGRQLAFAVGIAIAGAVFSTTQRMHLNSYIVEGRESITTVTEASTIVFRYSVIAGSIFTFIAVILSIRLSGYASHASKRIGN